VSDVDANQIPPHFIVLVPGYMGSQLRDRQTGQMVWVDFPSLLRNPLEMGVAIDQLLEHIAYPNDALEPAGIVNDVLFVPPWAKQEQYGRLTQKLTEWGYQIDPPSPHPDRLSAYTFAYDWRQDNRISARQLAKAVGNWRDRHNGAKAILIAHSNGGIVARWYVQKEGGSQDVSRLFLMASPWDGAPKAIHVMMSGVDVLGLRLFNLFHLGERLKDVIRTFPSFYQLVPHANPFLRDQNNNTLDLFGNPSWLPEPDQRHMLADAYQFNQDLGMDLAVDTLCFFGRQKPTVTTGVVNLDDAGAWGDIQWITTQAGDGTVPERSAIHPNASAKLPFSATHGDIYVVDPVLEFLQWELLGKYKGQTRASLATDRYQVVFEPGQDIYSPGEEMLAWASISSLDGDQPVVDADVKASLTYHAPLPGSSLDSIPASSPEVRLKPVKGTPGRYEARWKAPSEPGYYKMQGRVRIVGERQIVLEELISIEAEPA
jgi:pimeloyl-ACP methyl ester carboxylesterase